MLLLLLLLLRPAPRALRPTAQPCCLPGSCPALAGKRAAGESRRAQAAGHGHGALGGGGRGPGSTPRARFGDGFSAAAMAAPSSPPPPAPSRRIPAACLRRLQPGRRQSRRVLRTRRKLLWLRGGFLRAQRVFVSGHTGKEGSVPSLTARTHPTFQTPEGETSGRDLAVCPPPPPVAPRGGLGCG